MSYLVTVTPKNTDKPVTLDVPAKSEHWARRKALLKYTGGTVSQVTPKPAVK